MQYEIINISNSLTLYYLQTDKFKTASFGAYFVRPMRQSDNPFKLLCLRVMKNATEKYPNKLSLYRHADNMFGTSIQSQSSTLGNNFIMGFDVNILNDKYVKLVHDSGDADLCDEAAALLNQLLFHPKRTSEGLFDGKIVEKEKDKFIDIIKSQKNDTYSYAISQAVKLMCKDEPVSYIPTEEAVQAIDAKLLTEYYDDISNTSSLDIVYTGATCRTAVIESVKKHFGDFSPAIQTPLEYSKPYRIPADIKRQEENCDSMQSKLVIGFRTPFTIFDGDKYYIAIMFDQIFGSGSASKLFLNVREKLGLCYSCASSYNAFNGNMVAHCAISDYNRVKAEREILAQLYKMQNGEISDFEIECAKQTVASAYNSIEDSPESIENYYFERMVFGVDADIEQSIASAGAVTKEQIVEYAKRVFPDTVYFLHGVKNWSNE